MSLNEVQSHFHGKATEDMGTILGTLMEVVKNSNIKLTKEQKDILSNKKDDVKLSSKSVVEIYSTPLLNGQNDKSRDQRSGILHIVRDP